jgi:outer membrane protein TolC
MKKQLPAYGRTFVMAMLIVGAALVTARAETRSQVEADSVTAAWSGEAPVLPARPTLDDYLRVAAWRSPALRAAFYRWQSDVERSGYTGKLPDPIVGYTYFIESVETRVGPQNQRFALRQMIPWFGTLGSRQDVSFQASEASWQAFHSKVLELQRTTRENLELLGFWESIARAKYRVALSQHPDVIRAQVELGKLEDRLLTVEEQLGPAAAHLRSILDIPDSTTLVLPDSIVVTEATVDRDTILTRAIQHNPSLKSQLYMIESARAGVRTAGKSYWPGLTLGLDYIDTGPARNPGVPDSGKDAFTVSVGVNVPIWFGANGARKREAEADMRARQHDYTDTRNQLAAAIDLVVYEYQDAMRKTQLYRDGLIPKAQQSLGASYTAYQAGEVDFLNVLDAQRQLLDFQLMFERSRSNLAIRRAQLEMLTGHRLEPAQE